ncbi:hypothetical protein F2P81_020884 [Scophthalmus maximus]|uniref:BPTI/Kunitz inhibitor domain-containing protein n=1 Tax=Scophthalmus maximus TaxID=52904 RepID=A0A6A4RZR9_SCOMX|nr:hypothetical protein F2P81_020884 [Scophthalmus maximus]
MQTIITLTFTSTIPFMGKRCSQVYSSVKKTLMDVELVYGAEGTDVLGCVQYVVIRPPDIKALRNQIHIIRDESLRHKRYWLQSVESLKIKFNLVSKCLNAYAVLFGGAPPELFIFNELCAFKDEPGPCKAIKERFFFNVDSGHCELFEYGGCGGNANNFLTLEACEETCVVSAVYVMLPVICSRQHTFNTPLNTPLRTRP